MAQADPAASDPPPVEDTGLRTYRLAASNDQPNRRAFLARLCSAPYWAIQFNRARQSAAPVTDKEKHQKFDN